MISLQLIALSQEMNFETNRTDTFLVLRLPDGSDISAMVDEETTALIVGQQVEAGTVPTPTPVRTARPHPATSGEPSIGEGTGYAQDDSSDLPPNTRIFGGEDTSAKSFEYDAPPPSPPVVVEDVITETPKPGKRKERKQAHQRTVPKDALGYPIIPVSAGQLDPAAILGGINKDEDGVGSI